MSEKAPLLALARLGRCLARSKWLVRIPPVTELLHGLVYSADTAMEPGASKDLSNDQVLHPQNNSPEYATPSHLQVCYIGKRVVVESTTRCPLRKFQLCGLGKCPNAQVPRIRFEEVHHIT